jgi:tight adherence protein C
MDVADWEREVLMVSLFGHAIVKHKRMHSMIPIAQLVSAPWWSAWMSGWEGPVVVFAATALVFFLLARSLLRKPSREQLRLQQIAQRWPWDQQSRQGTFGAWTDALAAQIPESEKERHDFGLLLRQAGMYAPEAAKSIYAMRFVLLAVPLVVAGVCAVLADAKYTMPILIGGGITAGVLAVVPRMYVFVRRRRRIARIREGLPDTLDMLSMCVGSGLELGDSLDHVASRLTEYPECAEELMLLKRQAELGSLRRALEDFARRVDLPETDQLASLLLRGSYLGTELVGALAEQAGHLRVMRRQAATLRANKTPVKLVLPVIFCFAPAALILLTGPAVVQLRDFLVGRSFAEALHPDRSVRTVPTGDAFGSQAIVEAIQGLDRPAASAR